MALCALACALLFPIPGNSAECLTYEGEISISGTLQRATSTDANDREETYWVVQLPAPACVAASSTDPDLNPAIDRVDRIQLVLSAEDYRRYRPLLGQCITARGALFGAHTAHHHTPVLLGEVRLESR